MSHDPAASTIWRVLIAVFVSVCLVTPLSPRVTAQNSPQLLVTNEFSLGDLCPVGDGLVSPDGTTVWSLISRCAGDAEASVVVLSIADGTIVSQSDPLGIPIAGNDLYFYDQPLSWGEDDTLNIDLVNPLSIRSTSFVLDTTTGRVAPVTDSPHILTPTAIKAALPDFSGYFDARYDDDRSRAVVIDKDTFHVFDLASGQVMMSDSPSPGGDLSWAWFGPGGQHVYATKYVDPDDWTNHATMLYVYDVASGEQVGAHELPSSVVTISPDERFAQLKFGANAQNPELSYAIYDLTTGAVSTPFPVHFTGVTLNTCKNDGRAAASPWVSDNPVATSVLWLPDSSGIVTLNLEDLSYGSCRSNDSRMRVYSVTG